MLVGLQQLALESQLCSPLQGVCPTLGMLRNDDQLMKRGVWSSYSVGARLRTCLSADVFLYIPNWNVGACSGTKVALVPVSVRDRHR